MFSTINEKVTLVAQFGPGQTGLATVGYALYKGDGTVFQARTTTGVTETAAPGSYRVELAASVFTGQFDGYVIWDTGGGSPLYAMEDVQISERLDVAVSSRADGSVYTSARAGKLDNLDAAVSTVATSVWAQTSRTLTSGTINYVGPVAAGGAAAVIQGDDYKAADGRALLWSSTGWPNLTGATVTFTALPLNAPGGTKFTKTGTVVAPTGTAQVQLELAAADTAGLAAGAWAFDIQATLTDGSKVTLVRSQMTVAANPA